MAASSQNSRQNFIDNCPPEISRVLDLIDSSSNDEAGQLLTQYVASFVHPDMVCSLAMMERLPENYKDAAVQFFQYCLHTGLTAGQVGDVYQFLVPHLLTSPAQH